MVVLSVSSAENMDHSVIGFLRFYQHRARRKPPATHRQCVGREWKVAGRVHGNFVAKKLQRLPFSLNVAVLLVCIFLKTCLFWVQQQIGTRAKMRENNGQVITRSSRCCYVRSERRINAQFRCLRAWLRRDEGWYMTNRQLSTMSGQGERVITVRGRYLEQDAVSPILCQQLSPKRDVKCTDRWVQWNKPFDTCRNKLYTRS